MREGRGRRRQDFKLTCNMTGVILSNSLNMYLTFSAEGNGYLGSEKKKKKKAHFNRMEGGDEIFVIFTQVWTQFTLYSLFLPD